MGLALSEKTLKKYFAFLSRLDNSTKKRLIIRLTESIEDNVPSSASLSELAGAWVDTKDSDEIIQEIKNSRINKQDTTNL